MFRNWLSLDDLVLLRQKGGPLVLRALSRLPLPGPARAIRAAAHVDDGVRHWWDLPAVRRRWQEMVAGDPERSFREAFLEEHPPPPGGWTALSLGCGTGVKEIEWARTGAFGTLQAWDASRPRIATATAEAREAGLAGVLDFRVADVFRDPLPPSTFDLVLFEQALHHLSPTRTVLRRVREAMRPGGLLYVDEYVGPDRFQWTDAQLAAVNLLLRELPLRYRRLWAGGGAKNRMVRPSKLLMVLNDPSEAADSTSILPVLREEFDVVSEKPYGGAVLHLLFEGIARNFLEETPETRRWLGRCFALEDELTLTGKISADFVVVVARTPGTRGENRGESRRPRPG